MNRFSRGWALPTIVCLLLISTFVSHRAFADSHNGIITVGETARFTVITPELIRIEYAPKSEFLDNPSLFAVNRGIRFLDYQVLESRTETVIDTGHMKLVYTPDGKSFSAANLRIFVSHADGAVTTWIPGLKNYSNLGGTLQNLDHVTGHKPVNDGVLARDGWSIIDDSKRNIFVQRSDESWVDHRPTNNNIDWYFFGYGNDYRGALKSLTAIGGLVPLPRKYVLGSWYSRWWPYTSQDYRNIVQEFHDRDFPLDMIVMDMDWHKKNSWTGYTFNRKLFPDAENFFQWLHERDLHVTLNDHPQGGVGPYEDRYPDFMKAMGRDPASQQTLPYNVGDQTYINTLFKFMHTPLEQAGVDFWWLDWMGDSNFPFNTIDWVNEYYYRHSHESGLRGQGFFRYADWGDHRHPIHFSGDTHASWETLAFEVPFTQSSGNAGVFYWSHDIGGFEGPRNGELLARWTQFGAFSAALRLHSINHRNFDKRPWTYSRRVEDAMRVAFHLRSEFFPYTYSASWQAHQDSLPLVRPVYLDYGDDEEAYKNSQEYLYGDSVLVAPVTSEGTGFRDLASQKVWIPKGTWFNWFTGERIVGPVTKTETVNLSTFPLYVKAGAPLTLQPYTERMATSPLKTLIVKAYEGANSETQHTQLYEDDGVTEDYLRGNHAVTDILYSRSQIHHQFHIAPTVGQFSGQVVERQYEIQLAGVTSAHQAKIDGRIAPFVFDQQAHVIRVLVPAQNVGREIDVTIDAD